MKKILIAVLTAIALLTTCMAFAADAPKANAKDECLLASKDCKNQVDSIQQRINRINTEINKGTKVYSADDLKKLKQKLQETDDFLKELEKPGR